MNERLRRVVERLELQPGERVLEIGARRFDVVFAVRVRRLHEQPDLAGPWLADGGRVISEYDGPTASAHRPRAVRRA